MREPGRAATAAVLLALVALGATLRALPLAEWPLWIDEAFTWRDAARPLAAYPAWDHSATHPPLSYLIVRAAVALARSDAEWVLRLPSAIAGVLAIPAGWLLGRTLGSGRLGLLLAFPLALDPLLVGQGRQARMYTLVVLFSLLAWTALARIDRDGGSWRAWLLFGAAIAAAAGTSWLGFVAWGAAVVAVGHGVVRRGPARGAGPSPVAGVLAASALALAVLAGGIDEWAGRLAGPQGFEGFDGLPVALEAIGQRFGRSPALAAGAAVVAAGAAAGLLRLGERAPLAARAILWTGLLSIPAVAVAGMARPFGVDRFAILLRVAAYAGLAALAALPDRGWPRRAAVLALAAASAGGLVLALRLDRPRVHDLGEIAARVAAARAPGDAVLFVPPWNRAAGRYYGAPEEPHVPDDAEWRVPAAWPYPRTWVVLGPDREPEHAAWVAEVARRHGAPFDPDAVRRRAGPAGAVALRFEDGRTEVLLPRR